MPASNTRQYDQFFLSNTDIILMGETSTTWRKQQHLHCPDKRLVKLDTETDSELGQPSYYFDSRTLTVLFPAQRDRRYAAQSRAPLTRIQLK